MRASLGAAHLGQPEDLSALQKSPLGVTPHIRAGITTDDDEPDEERRAAMIAAVYGRKSTDQTGVADEQKSVARQIEHARQYAARKGWTVADEHVYVDDGISGAEFANRPGFLRLMNALKPRPPFQVLVMSEESRLGPRSDRDGVRAQATGPGRRAGCSSTSRIASGRSTPPPTRSCCR